MEVSTIESTIHQESNICFHFYFETCLYNETSWSDATLVFSVLYKKRYIDHIFAYVYIFWTGTVAILIRN